MRCLVKNIALYGLGLSIFSKIKEDLPSDLSDEGFAEDNSEQKKTTTRRTKAVNQPSTQPVDRLAPIKNAINNTATTDELLDLYLQHQTEVEGNPEIKALFTERKQQLKQAA